jgi:hypothetical protein
VLEWRLERQSAQIRWVQGRILGGVEEDQQTMQSGSSTSGVSSCWLDSVGGSGAVALDRLLRNLSNLGRLAAAAVSFDGGLSGSRLQVMLKAVKTKASDQ